MKQFTALDWDLSDIFSGIDSPAYIQFKQQIGARLHSLGQNIEVVRAATPAPISEWSSCLRQLEQLECDIDHLQSYIICAYCSDPAAPGIQREYGECMPLDAAKEQLTGRFSSGLSSLADGDFDSLMQHQKISPVGYHIERLLARSEQQRDSPAYPTHSTHSSSEADYHKLTGALEFEMR